jgi:hypothetical protein
MRVGIAATGILSIFLGYRLFCDLSRATLAGARSVSLTNLASGALLAVFGLGILVADVHGTGIATHLAPGVSRTRAARQGVFHAPAGAAPRVAQHLI